MAAHDAELAALIQEVSQKNAPALEALYARTSSSLYGLLLRKLRSRERAEDALQDCYLKVWRHSGTYAPAKGAAMTWLSTMARHQACDLARHQRCRPEVSIGEERVDAWDWVVDPSPDVESQVDIEQAMRIVRPALAALAAGERRTISLVFLEELSIPEAAVRMGVPLGTAKSWLRRGMLKLRKACAALETSPPAPPRAATGRAWSNA